VLCDHTGAFARVEETEGNPAVDDPLISVVGHLPRLCVRRFGGGAL